MKKRYFTLFIGIALAFTACQPTPKQAPQTTVYENKGIDTSNLPTDEKIFDQIMQIAEVQESNRQIDSLSNHTKGIALMIVERPNDGLPYFSVKVGYDGDTRFETYYLFYVDPKTLAVKIEDILSGEVLTLDEWRKQKKAQK